MVGDDRLRVERPGVGLDYPTANNVGDDEEELTARIDKLPLGTPVSEVGLSRLH